MFKNKKMAGHMGARNRTQQNLEIVRTDPIRGLLFIKGSVPGPQGQLADRQRRDQAAAAGRCALSRCNPGIAQDRGVSKLPAAGLVDDAAVHEIPALPSDEEVAAIAAEQEAGAAAETNEGTDAEAGQATPSPDESKEG